MMMTRRRSMGLAGAALAAMGAPRAFAKTRLDPRFTERGVGSDDAAVSVIEFFCLTCPNSARFAAEVYPGVKTGLIDTGKLRYVFSDFPLDQVGLLAAMIARSLPEERYVPFCANLLASQKRWAEGGEHAGIGGAANAIEGLARIAGEAGISRRAFEAIAKDRPFAETLINIKGVFVSDLELAATPTFVFNGPRVRNRVETGRLGVEEFSRIVAEVAA